MEVNYREIIENIEHCETLRFICCPGAYIPPHTVTTRPIYDIKKNRLTKRVEILHGFRHTEKKLRGGFTSKSLLRLL